MLAKDSLKDLDAECDVTFTPIDTKAAILSSEQQSELSRLYDEAQMVEYLTPRLEGLFAPTGRVIANSEDFAFLPVQFHNNQKPDLTLSEPCVYTRKVPRRFVGTIPDRRFAAPAVALLDSVYFIDAKLDLTNHALGELIIHLQLQGDHTHAPHRGVLAGRAGFWLIEVERHVLTHRTCCAWTAGGSVELMQSYLAPLPWNCVTAVCEKLGFTPVDTLRHQGIDSPFLGAGGFGRVFAVLTSNEENRNSSNKDLLAVKCMNGSLPVLTREWSKMHRHAQHCTCDLIAKPVSQIMSVGVIHAFAMIPAGMHAVKRDMLLLAGQKGQRAMRDVFQALRGLHAHPGGPICHGDARLPNLIVARGGHLFWVDLRETDISQSDAGLATLINADCTTLVQSVLAGVQLTANITVAIDSYVAATTTERADLVAGAVYEHLQSLPYGI